MKWWRLIVPEKPLPIVVPWTSTRWPTANTPIGTCAPALYSAATASATRNSWTISPATTPAFARWPASGLLTRDAFFSPKAGRPFFSALLKSATLRWVQSGAAGYEDPVFAAQDRSTMRASAPCSDVLTIDYAGKRLLVANFGSEPTNVAADATDVLLTTNGEPDLGNGIALPARTLALFRLGG